MQAYLLCVEIYHLSWIERYLLNIYEQEPIDVHIGTQEEDKLPYVAEGFVCINCEEDVARSEAPVLSLSDKSVPASRSERRSHDASLEVGVSDDGVAVTEHDIV